MLVQNWGFGCTDIGQLTYQKKINKCNRYVVQMEIGPTTYTKVIIEFSLPLYYKIIKPQNITMTNIQQSTTGIQYR
jgi:hypothetical protein